MLGRAVEKANCHTVVSRVSSFQVDIGQAVFGLMGNLADGRHAPDMVQTKLEPLLNGNVGVPEKIHEHNPTFAAANLLEPMMKITYLKQVLAVPCRDLQVTSSPLFFTPCSLLTHRRKQVLKIYTCRDIR
ncbi:hypothetical protein ElyMa_000456200 [Elysia marginata]|uniref:Uncharacterized protein n=1 Tax=Elysia marginata TaxID=1093978 RepID=A0AAV4FPT7_9GAST|nr:hypothetical protein ElyMa_000456200 [Elysia marginata]